MSLDLLAQWEGFERNGQFRFTPPTHALLAFAKRSKSCARKEALRRGHSATARITRRLLAGMRRLGFREYFAAERQSDIITSFRYPDDPGFRFEEFYRRLAARGFVIYPGKVSQADCFRIGTIGHITEEDVGALSPRSAKCFARSAAEILGLHRLF